MNSGVLFKKKKKREKYFGTMKIERMKNSLEYFKQRMVLDTHKKKVS